MGWSGWGKSGNLTTIMNTNKAKRKTNRRQNQTNSTSPTTTLPRASQAAAETAPGAQTAPLPGLSHPMTAAQFRRPLEPRPSQPAPAQGDPDTEALVNAVLESPARASGVPPQAKVGAGPARPKAHQVIKLGIDVHAGRYVVVRQIDGATPQAAQGFGPGAFVAWARKQTELADQVYTCYEAGPFGYGLHRRLSALGVTNYVVRPRDWDEYGQKVKTDKRDARELALNLDRYVRGNQKAFSVVRVPTEAEEQARSRSRQREAFQKEKQRLAAQGRSHGLYYGALVEGPWWEKGAWEELVVPPIVLELLTALRCLIQAVDQGLQACTQALVAAPTAQALPVGLGKLTHEILEREVGDWHRFANRRQVASYTGMCPCEDSSDQRRFQGAITKHGNPRVRTPLVEAAWRLLRFQPAYKPVAKWRPTLLNRKTTKSKRKQIAVAIGRQFSVDWWRVRTGQCQLADLGLRVQPGPVAPAATPQAERAPSRAAEKA